jgi:hypothetical protein
VGVWEIISGVVALTGTVVLVLDKEEWLPDEGESQLSALLWRIFLPIFGFFACWGGIWVGGWVIYLIAVSIFENFGLGGCNLSRQRMGLCD